MSKLLDRAHRWLFVAVATLLCVSLFAPVMTTHAQDAASGTTVIAHTGGDGAILRADAGADAPAITTLAEGTEVVVLAGPVSDPAGNSWLQVSAQGSTGYVSAAFVGSGTGSSSGNGSSTVAAEPTSTQAELPNGPSAPAWVQPIDHGVVVNNVDQGGLPADGLAIRVSASPDAEVIDRVYEGNRLDVTSQKIWSGNTPYYQVNFGGGGGFVNAWFLTLDSEAVPATEVVTEVPTEAVTEVPTDVATETPTEVVTEVPTEAVTVAPTEVVTEAPTDIASGTPIDVATQAPTEVAAETPTSVVTEAPTAVASETPAETTASTPVVILTSIATEVPTETVSGTPAVTDVPTEGVSTPTVTEVPTDAPAGTPAVTEVSTSTATVVAPATPTATETQTPVTSPLDSLKAIGSATVTGTNGEGIRCRISPDSSASTIVVLAEGTRVHVYSAPGNGWLQIGCGDQLGFGNINYLWSGGASDADINSGGRLSVSGTGGGLNCRTGAGTSFGVITVIADGTAVTIRGQAANGWTPVTCNGQNGFVSSDYLSVSPINDGGNTGGTTGAGTVSGTGGDGVRCRTGASTDSTVILLVGEGTKVTIRGASSNGWTPVTCGGQNGFISSQYLTASNGGNPTATNTPVPGGGASTGNVIVTGSGGGVNCRSGAGLNYGVIAVVADGATVPTRSGSMNGWQAVTCGGKSGFILADLTTPTQGGGTTPTPTTTPGDGGGPISGTATVTGTGGDGVRCRVSAPSGNPITVLPEGTTVSLRGSASNGWQPVVCGGQNGFVSSQYLTLGGGGSTTPTPGTTPPPANGGLVANDHALVDADVNLRYQPSLGSGVSIVVPSGIVVLITGSVTSGFYPVNYDGLKGYMSADYLSKTSAELSKRGGSGNPGTEPTPIPGGGSATGNAMVNFAMGYLGYPYVWATHGPSSFDCSGFTWWVAKNVLGIDIGTGTWTQSVSGTPVSRANLQPGDLVFFQNTYEAGLSHVGIYIGNDQFIHAENETTGVRISDLNSQYYSSRWYGAVRLA